MIRNRMHRVFLPSVLVVLSACSARNDPPAAPATAVTAADSVARADSLARAVAIARADSITRMDSVARAERAARERTERERAERARARTEAAEREAEERAGAALLPHRRIVAFYGNPQSTRMGILGELPPVDMLARLDREVSAWEAADPGTPVVPALHMIAVMAAGDSGADGRYRVRMPARVIEDVITLADQRGALVFLDIQPGRSTVQAELTRLLPYLRRPNVHLGLDPEWAMPPGSRPGERVGSMNAATINHAIEALAGLVDEYDLPPKVLVVHRFTSGMVRNAAAIRNDPRVQVVLHMDGWGSPSQKRATYRSFVAPVEHVYKGFKLFYRNDVQNGSRLMTPEEVLRLAPPPIYIQYQ